MARIVEWRKLHDGVWEIAKSLTKGHGPILRVALDRSIEHFQLGADDLTKFIPSAVDSLKFSSTSNGTDSKGFARLLYKVFGFPEERPDFWTKSPVNFEWDWAPPSEEGRPLLRWICRQGNETFTSFDIALAASLILSQSLLLRHLVHKLGNAGPTSPVTREAPLWIGPDVQEPAHQRITSAGMTLVCALRAENAAILDGLKASYQWSAAQLDELRKKTEWMRYGPATEMANILDLFSLKPTDSPDEWDLVVVQISIEPADDRFRGNTLQLIEAFRSLGDRSRPDMVVSARLPKESLVGMGFAKKG